MTILASDLLARLRIELNDPNAARFSDSELLTYANDAINDYSRHFRLQKTAQIAVSAGGLERNTRFFLPEPCERVVRIAYTVGNVVRYLIEKPYRAGEVTRIPGAEGFAGFRIPRTIIMGPSRAWLGHYELSTDETDADTLVSFKIDFVPDQAAYFTIDYLVKHTLFDPNNPASTTDVPAEDIELLDLYAQAKAWLRIESQDTSLSRWRTREEGSRRDDSPVIPHATRLFAAYEQKKRDRLAQPRTGRRLLRR
jgi:hypothetical protein